MARFKDLKTEKRGEGGTHDFTFNPKLSRKENKKLRKAKEERE